MNTIAVGKFLIIAGVVVSLIGVFLWGLGKSGFNGIPGDIRISRGNFSFYFPIATCIALSIVLSLVLSIISRFRK
jgi:hypothetical protein